jgi:hypothetical protein
LSGADERAGRQQGKTEAEVARVTRAQRWARALPSLVAALGAFVLLFPQKALLERLVMAGFTGLLLPLGGLVLGVLAEHTVRRIATGQEPQSHMMTADKELAAAVSLVFVVVWLLGVYWRVEERARITRCLKEVEQRALVMQHGDSVSWYCTEVYKLGSGTSYSDE